MFAALLFAFLTAEHANQLEAEEGVCIGTRKPPALRSEFVRRADLSLAATDARCMPTESLSRPVHLSFVAQTCLYARVVCTSPRAEYERSQQRALSPAAHCDADASASGVFASCGVSVSLLRQWSVSRGRGAAACGNPQQQLQLKREMQSQQQKAAPQQGQQNNGGKKRKAQNDMDGGGAER